VGAAGADSAETLEVAIIRPNILAVETADSAPEASEAAPSTVIGEVWRDMALLMILDEINHLMCAYDAS
jgi:hypothetical protein